MNEIIRRCGLLMLGMTAACTAEVGPPSEQSPAPSAPKVASRSAPKVASRSAPRRDGAPFSRKVQEQLAARGIKVHGGPERSTDKAHGGPERSTVALPWIVQGHTMQRVDVINPTTFPHRYAVQLTMRAPLVVRSRSGRPVIDPTQPYATGTCSGTLVDGMAVLTAAHCYVAWLPIGRDLATGAVVREKVKMYSMYASPRRNGTSSPFGEIAVKKAFWEFSNWPGSDPGVYEMDRDYAVMRLKSPVWPFIPVANRRVVEQPTGKTIDMAHYPFQVERGFRMYYSIGDIGGVHASYANVYKHNASGEPGSSGGGVFEAGVDGVVGVNVAEARLANPGPSDNRRPGQTLGPLNPAGPRPNRVLMLTSASDANISTWINTPL